MIWMFENLCFDQLNAPPQVFLEAVRPGASDQKYFFPCKREKFFAADQSGCLIEIRER
jgi:hypothetical protein